MKGPVPRAALLRSPCFLIPASLMMKPQNPPSAASSPAKGSLVRNLTPYLPAGSTLSTAMKSDLPGDFSNRRSKVNFTSAEVSSCPSWNFTPCRSLNVQVKAVLADLPGLGQLRHRGHVRLEADELVVHHRRAGAPRERRHQLGIEPGGLGGPRRDERPPGLRGLAEGGAAEGEGAEREAARLEELAAAEGFDAGRGIFAGHGVGLLCGIHCSLGSRTSRRPSPSRLKARTATMMAMPGNTEIQGAVSR